MEFPDPINPDQESQAGKDGLAEIDGTVKRKPKFGFYRETTQGHPGRSNKKASSRQGEEVASPPINSIEALITPAAINERPADTLPESEPAPAVRTKHAVRSSGQGVAQRSEQDMNPGRRLHAMEEAAKGAPPAKIPWKYRVRPTRETTRKAYWDVTATMSLIVNAVLVGLLIVMALQIRNLKTIVSSLMGGLYGNFVKMDQASINTTIAVNAQIPLDFNLPVSQNTEVVLTGDVTIPSAHVVINTGVLNINALASVTLPAGTTLPIALNMDIPVQSTIPISLQVPVSIPLNQTDLHAPFTGLQTTLRPLYCTFDKNAQYPEGTYICAEHDSPTPTAP